jgi:ubiquinone/menaquinone biosynthesis C-methylase UbiE
MSSTTRTETADEEREYLLGTHAEEYERLGFQHRVWAAPTFELWEAAGLGPGQRLLDVGAGPGFASVDLAYLVGRAGHVLAADASARFLGRLEATRDALLLPWIETRLGDVQELELDEASLDGAFARWCLCFLPRPEAVIERVARALRPGGVFVAMDYFRYEALALSPRSAALERVVVAVIESWRRAGGDLDIASRLPELFARAGLEVELVREFARVARPGSALWRWPEIFFLGYVPKLVELGLLTPAEREAFERDWHARSRDARAFFATPPVYGIVARKR